jgi:hypothetical protein
MEANGKRMTLSMDDERYIYSNRYIENATIPHVGTFITIFLSIPSVVIALHMNSSAGFFSWVGFAVAFRLLPGVYLVIRSQVAKSRLALAGITKHTERLRLAKQVTELTGMTGVQADKIARKFSLSLFSQIGEYDLEGSGRMLRMNEHHNLEVIARHVDVQVLATA